MPESVGLSVLSTQGIPGLLDEDCRARGETDILSRSWPLVVERYQKLIKTRQRDGNTHNKTGRELLLELATAMNYADPDGFVDHGAQALQEMRDAGILIGIRRAE